MWKKLITPAKNLHVPSKSGSFRPVKDASTFRGTYRKQRAAWKTKLKQRLADFDIMKLLEVPEEYFSELVQNNLTAGLAPEEAEYQGNLDARREWLALNTMDFYNEITLTYEELEDIHDRVSTRSGYENLAEERRRLGKSNVLVPFNDGFPPGVIYVEKGKKKSKGSSYCAASLDYLHDTIYNDAIFPEDQDQKFPEDFETRFVPEMFKRMFRMYGIIFNVLLPFSDDSEFLKYAHVTFKHFYFFMKRYKLLQNMNERELFVFRKSGVKSLLDLTVLDREYERLYPETKTKFFSVEIEPDPKIKETLDSQDRPASIIVTSNRPESVGNKKSAGRYLQIMQVPKSTNSHVSASQDVTLYWRSPG